MKRNIVILLAFVAALVIVRSDGQTIIPNGQGVGSSSSSSSSGGGATSLSAITDFLLVKTSDSVMSINTSATTSAPVNGRIGSQPYSFTSGSAVTRSGTTCSATQYWYVASSGALTMGHNGSSCTYTSTGTTAIVIATPITGFPVDSIPLWVSTTTTGVWDPVTGTADKRAFIAAQKTITAGTNVTVTETATNITIDATGGSSTFDVTAPTNFFRRWVSNGFTNTFDWQYNNCSTANGNIGNTSVDFAGIYGSDTTSGCFIGFPSSASGNSQAPPNFVQGTYLMGSRSGRHNASAGDIYYGIFNTNSGTPADFVGPRWNHGSSIFQCVIRSSGTDRVATTIAGTNDTNLHWFYTSNNGTANSVTCQIDSNTAVTVTNASFPSFTTPKMGMQTAPSTGQGKHTEGFLKITGRVM
jgi:hypothetical protein